MPPRRNVEGQNAQGNDVPTNVELAQGLQQLTQLTQALGNALLQNQNGNDVAKSVAARHPPNFLGQEDPIIMEDWIRTFDKLFDAVNCPMEHRVDTAAERKIAVAAWNHDPAPMSPPATVAGTTPTPSVARYRSTPFMEFAIALLCCAKENKGERSSVVSADVREKSGADPRLPLYRRCLAVQNAASLRRDGEGHAAEKLRCRYLAGNSKLPSLLHTPEPRSEANVELPPATRSPLLLGLAAR
nr:uncharacterized protein LOC109183675 [Ipomoea trifida]